jgi:drug/metabolite transporter (DMT)-like permease
MKCCQTKRAKKRTSSNLPSDFSSENNDDFEHSSGQSPSSAAICFFPSRYAPIIYTVTYFICMVIVDFTIEGTQNAFPDLLSLPYAMTLFQFSFCFFLPVAISKGKTLKNLPTTIIKISPYLVLSLVVSFSNVCKSASARYVSFPTKVIFRSTKLIPVMIVASILNIDKQRKYGRLDFLAALMLCMGAVGYGLGEHSLNYDKNDSYFGLLLLTGSVLCDAFTPNIKQWLMNPTTKIQRHNEPVVDVDNQGTKMIWPKNLASSSLSSLTSTLPDIIIYDSSGGSEHKQVIAKRLPRKQPRFLDRGGLGLSATELMTNIYAVGCLGLFAFMTVTGHMGDAVGEAMVRPHLFANLTMIGTALSTAVFAHTRLIKESGAVTAVTVTTLREFVTVLLSYLIYPKIFSTLHAISALSVFGGILLSIYTDVHSRSEKRKDENGSVVVGMSPTLPKTQITIEMAS